MNTWIEFLALIGQSVNVVVPGFGSPVAAQVTGVEPSGDLNLRITGHSGLPASVSGHVRGVIYTGSLDQDTGMPEEYLEAYTGGGERVVTCWAPAVEYNADKDDGQELVADNISLADEFVDAWKDKQAAKEVAAKSGDFEIKLPVDPAVTETSSDPALVAAYGDGGVQNIASKTVAQVMEELPGITEDEAEEVVAESGSGDDTDEAKE